MIIKGNAVTGPQALARYLQSKEVNERAEVLEVRGTAASDAEGALIEMDAYAEGTQCEKPLYHVKINPEPPYRLTPEQLDEALELIEQKFGLEGHARVVVIHEKLGRQHIHAIWSRIDLENLRAVPLSHNYRKHEEIARELERRFGHPRVQGAHAERDDTPRPERTPSLAEVQQQERTGISAKDVKAEVTAIKKGSDHAEAFRAGLEDAGYVLAKGDRRDFVIVDRAGGIHSLARRIEGIKAAELRSFMSTLDRDAFPSIEEAKGIVEDRERGVYSARDFEKWDDHLAAKAIERELQSETSRKANRSGAANSDAYLDSQDKYGRQWEDALWSSSIKKAEAEEKEAFKLRELRRKARSQTNIEKDYASGDGYVDQSDAALTHDKKRRKGLSKQGTPFHPSEHVPPTPENIFPRASDSLRRRRRPDRRDTPDVPLGQTVPDTGRSKRVDELRKRVETFLYGPRGHEWSTQRREARESSIEANTNRDELAERDFMKDKKLGPKFDKFDHVEKSEKLHERMQRLFDSIDPDVEHREPDRQRKAPGGGRSRSR